MNISYSASDLYNKISSNGNTFISSYRKKVREADTNVQDLQDDIEGFRKNIRNLKNYNSDSMTRSKMEKNLKKFADSYNELRDSSEEITDKELSKSLTKLEDFMEENKKSLRKLGLKESKGKWSFDSELFEETKDKDINKLFEGKDAIFKQIDKMMRKVEKKADEEEHQMVLRNFHSVTQYSQEEMKLSMSAHHILGVIDGMEANNQLVQSYDTVTGNNSADVIQAIEDNKSNLSDFCSYYNNIVSMQKEASSEYAGYMQTRSQEKEEQLNNIGISIVDGNLEYDVNKTIDDAYKASYAALFGENAAYGSLMKTYAENIFKITLKTESLGITIDSYA